MLVIFIIRINGRPRGNWPSPALAVSSLLALVGAVARPFTPAEAWFGFHAPPATTRAGIGVIVVGYLVAAELLKPFASGVVSRSPVAWRRGGELRPGVARRD